MVEEVEETEEEMRRALGREGLFLDAEGVIDGLDVLFARLDKARLDRRDIERVIVEGGGRGGRAEASPAAGVREDDIQESMWCYLESVCEVKKQCCLLLRVRES